MDRREEHSLNEKSPVVQRVLSLRRKLKRTLFGQEYTPGPLDWPGSQFPFVPEESRSVGGGVNFHALDLTHASSK